MGRDMCAGYLLPLQAWRRVRSAFERATNVFWHLLKMMLLVGTIADERNSAREQDWIPDTRFSFVVHTTSMGILP